MTGAADVRKWIVLLLAALPLPALAGDCDHWSAGMQDEEEGRIMTARICTSDGKASHDLFITCGEPGKLAIRYLPAAFEPADPEFKTTLQFSVDPASFAMPAQYESMDGALAAETDIGAPFMQALQTGKSVKLSDVKGKVPTANFTLKGSKAALGKLLATCAKQ